jgi:YbgC/YbaW family acyl-CoA thioester hydrolase
MSQPIPAPRGEAAPGGEPASSAVPAEVLRSWRGARDELLAAIGDLSDEQLDQAPAPGEWSARQQLAHLGEMEGIWLSWALQVAADPGCQFGERGQTATPSVDSAAAWPRERLIDRLCSARAATTAAVADLPARALNQIGYHRWFGEMSALQCLKAIYRHDRMHTEQILGKPTSFQLPPLPDIADDAGWFRLTRRVAWSETDPSNAYQFADVLRYAEDAETAFLRRAGLLPLLYPRMPRVYAEVRYRAPAFFDQELDIDLALVRLGRTSLHYAFRVVRGPTLCAQGRMGAVTVDSAGQSRPLPEEARELLAGYVRPGLVAAWD